MALTLELYNGNFIFKGRTFNSVKDKNTLLEPFNKQVLNYGLVLSLLPNEEQIINLNKQIGNSRFVANDYLNKRNKLYDNTKQILSVSAYKKELLPLLKEENEWLKLSDKFALESAIEHIDNAFNNFYRTKKGFPKFVSKYKPNGNSYTTKFTNNNIELLIENNIPYIKLPKVGKVRFILPKGKTINDLINNNIKIINATISRQSASINKYTVSLCLETIIDKINPINSISKDTIYGLDLGIKHFAIYGNESSTTFVENPRWIKVHTKRLKRLQQALSRKQYNSSTHKGSKNYYKTKEKLNKEHKKISNQRKDFHHKLSKEIVNKANCFICEDLNIKGMIKNHKLAKEISSTGWSQFITFVKYKLERKGGIFIKVNRFYASSKLCNICGYKNTSLTLNTRTWTCPICNTFHDRDENAKFNLIKEGINILTNDLKIPII